MNKQEVIAVSLKAISGWWWHHLSNVWLVAGPSLTPQAVFDKIAPNFMLSGTPADYVFMAKIDPYGYWGSLPREAWDWISQVRQRPAP